jgi:hypothetical protein
MFCDQEILDTSVASAYETNASDFASRNGKLMAN